MKFTLLRLAAKLLRLRGPDLLIIYGELSNYPACDILWFLIRFKLCITVPQYASLTLKLARNPDYQHIPCPFCRLKNFLLRRKPVYHTCPQCGWIQLEEKKCRLRGIPAKILKEMRLSDHKHPRKKSKAKN